MAPPAALLAAKPYRPTAGVAARLRRILALTLSRWPHRAGRPTGLVRHAPRGPVS
jgi:hypothetical protein